ncbi:hypothetical protein [Bradyrhizobium septentrionale]|uniref:Uncharacterized protein n=1 Tax=Bradyrhizobium septentrionale TaxID=1404411 RepID=A0ABZ2PAC4_9BRAD|nr:hypothetical protein [Bradyrhizobium septentrionale]
MDNDQPLAGAILTAMVIAAVVWATLGSPPVREKVSHEYRAIAGR